jgi:hypothetical protein
VQVATVVVNCLIWDKHASMYGLAALFVSLVCSAFYQRVPFLLAPNYRACGIEKASLPLPSPS